MTRTKLIHALCQVLWQLLALMIAAGIMSMLGIRKLELIDLPIAAGVLLVINFIQVQWHAKRSRSAKSQ